MGDPALVGVDNREVLLRLGVALCIGLFIGLEREYSHADREDLVPAGFRTFGLIGLLGAVCCYLGLLLSPWVLPAALVVLGALLLAAYLEARDARAQAAPHAGVGLTTEVSALLTFGLGALAMHGDLSTAGVIAVATTLVLSAKKRLHGFVHALGEQDMVATIKFAVITFIILPILPDHWFGPYQAFNLHRTWLMVVLIAGIGFLGYVLTKVIGAERGIPLSGLVGGLASSTAVTLSSARRSKTDENLSEPLALGVILACTVMVPRVALVTAAISPQVAVTMVPTFVAMLVGSLVMIIIQAQNLKKQLPTDDTHQTQHTNPFDLEPALKFAVAFAVITFLVRAAKSANATGGIYAVSGLSGLVDADAAAVSLAQQTLSGLDLHLAARGVALSMIVNNLFKGAMAYGTGSKLLGKRVFLGLAVVAGIGAVVAFTMT